LIVLWCFISQEKQQQQRKTNLIEVKPEHNDPNFTLFWKLKI